MLTVDRGEKRRRIKTTNKNVSKMASSTVRRQGVFLTEPVEVSNHIGDK